MTQKEAVLEYMKTNGSITQMDAYREIGTTRLGARINELRKEGYCIITNTETSKTRTGHHATYARYTLANSGKPVKLC